MTAAWATYACGTDAYVIPQKGKNWDVVFRRHHVCISTTDDIRTRQQISDQVGETGRLRNYVVSRSSNCDIQKEIAEVENTLADEIKHGSEEGVRMLRQVLEDKKEIARLMADRESSRAKKYEEWKQGDITKSRVGALLQDLTEKEMAFSADDMAAFVEQKHNSGACDAALVSKLLNEALQEDMMPGYTLENSLHGKFYCPNGYDRLHYRPCVKWAMGIQCEARIWHDTRVLADYLLRLDAVTHRVATNQGTFDLHEQHLRLPSNR